MDERDSLLYNSRSKSNRDYPPAAPSNFSPAYVFIFAALAAIIAMNVVILIDVRSLTAPNRASSANASETCNSTHLVGCLTAVNMRIHLEALENAAYANISTNNGIPTRACGSPGFDATVAYIKSQLSDNFAVKDQWFSMISWNADTFQSVVSINDVVVNALVNVYSGSFGELSDQLALPAVYIQGDVCSSSTWTNVTAPTNTTAKFAAVVSVKDYMDNCTVDVIRANAKTNAMFSGKMILVSVGDIEAQPFSTFDASVISVSISREDGEALINNTLPIPPSVIVYAPVSFSNITTRNVIADYNREGYVGMKNSTVVIVGHIDSVPSGPGINDDGSGSMTVLEIARQIEATDMEVVNHLRFVFVSGEEEGLRGSDFYVKSLNKTGELDDVVLALDLDMLGSPNWIRQLYNGTSYDVGSGQVQALFHEYYLDHGLPYMLIPFDGRSDYAPFMAFGVASGGITTGADSVKTIDQREVFGGMAGSLSMLDPCYHQLCDSVANVDFDILEDMGRAAIWFTQKTAQMENLDDFIYRKGAPKTKKSEVVMATENAKQRKQFARTWPKVYAKMHGVSSNKFVKMVALKHKSNV